MLRRVELVTGLVAGAMTGVAVLASALAIQAINIGSGSSPPGGGSSPRTLVFLGLIGLGGLSAALGGYLHAARTIDVALGLVWLAAGLLLLFAVAGLSSIGAFNLPGALLALVAAVAGSQTHLARREQR